MSATTTHLTPATHEQRLTLARDKYNMHTSTHGTTAEQAVMVHVHRQFYLHTRGCTIESTRDELASNMNMTYTVEEVATTVRALIRNGRLLSRHGDTTEFGLWPQLEPWSPFIFQLTFSTQLPLTATSVSIVSHGPLDFFSESLMMST